MSREASMNYTKHQIDTQLNEFLEKFNATSRKYQILLILMYLLLVKLQPY